MTHVHAAIDPWSACSQVKGMADIELNVASDSMKLNDKKAKYDHPRTHT